MDREYIRYLLRSKYPSQKKAAEALGITPQHLSRVLNGQHKITEKLRFKILGLTPSSGLTVSTTGKISKWIVS